MKLTQALIVILFALSVYFSQFICPIHSFKCYCTTIVTSGGLIMHPTTERKEEINLGSTTCFIHMFLILINEIMIRVKICTSQINIMWPDVIFSCLKEELREKKTDIWNRSDFCN